MLNIILHWSIYHGLQQATVNNHLLPDAFDCNFFKKISILLGKAFGLKAMTLRSEILIDSGTFPSHILNIESLILLYEGIEIQVKHIHHLIPTWESNTSGFNAGSVFQASNTST